MPGSVRVNDAYKPPRAPVADPLPPAVAIGKRPWPISLASILIVLVIVNECVRLTSGDHYTIGVSVSWVVLLTVIALMMERGRNWARWVLLIMTVLSTLSLAQAWFAPMPVGVKLVPDVAHAIRSLAAELCLVAATGLAFGPGRAWFRR